MALVQGANSYGTRSEADLYFNDSLKADDWSVIEPDDKERGLIEAARVFERRAWVGSKEVSNQAMAFPRTGLTFAGESIDAAKSLEIIKQAQFEYAYSIISKPNILKVKDPTGTGNIKRVDAGGAKVEFFKPTGKVKFPDPVLELITEFLTGYSSGDIIAGYVSGATDSSSFSDLTEYDVY